MAKWMQLESPQCSSDNDDSYDIETNNMCTADEPIDLKQVNCESHPAHEDTSNSDWDTSRLVKTKAFRIKDILGLDDNERISNAKSMSIPTTSPSTVPCMYLYIFHLIN